MLKAARLQLRLRRRAAAAETDGRSPEGLADHRLHDHVRVAGHPLRILLSATHCHGRDSVGIHRRNTGTSAVGAQLRLHVPARARRVFWSRRKRLIGDDQFH